MGRVYFFPSNTFIHNDKVLPIILALAAERHTVETVFLTPESVATLGGSSPYAVWLRSFTRCRYCVFAVSGFWRRVVVRVQFVRLLCAMALRRRYVAFFDSRPASRPVRILSAIAYRRGTSVVYTPWYLNPLQSIDWRAVLADPDRCRVLKNRTCNPTTIPKSAPAACTTLLSYHPIAPRQAEEVPHKRVLLIPHPKLHEWWREFVRQHPPAFGDDLGALDRFVAVFLTHFGNYIFRDDSDLDVLITEIISTVRNVFPSIPIVLKPKQSLLAIPKQRQRLNALIAGIGGITVTDAPTSLLAPRALAGITTGHTTAQFEWMVSDAPWIEYCRYSDFWTGVYPPKTYTPQYGGTWVETPEALDRVLQNLDRYRGDRKRYEKLLAFEEAPISLDDFMRPAQLLR